jgi:hypothetical protein
LTVKATIALAGVIAAAVVLPTLRASNAVADPVCSSGAHSLSPFGSRVYPDQGNGGYSSVHTDLFVAYDTTANLFLPGTHADLTVRSTQCLTDLSFDFERTNANSGGPNMSVDSVTVDGQPASFTFVQPTYPGDPNGQNDPDPAAHAMSNSNPVSATNPNPPACSPQTSGNSQNGLPCPANKLVITPSSPIPEGTTAVVRINYTGRPGVHVDGDGSTEGWFRVNTTAAPNDGGFVTTEPIGNASWMPLNNHPTAKPTYDIYDTVPIGKTAIGPGELVGTTPPTGTTYAPVSPTSVNPPDANFPGGSSTWHWHSPEHIASYLVENSIGSYDLTARRSPTTGIDYYEAQAGAITDARKAINKIAMDNQEDITNFQTNFDGAFPFTTDGVVVGIPSASFEEEMQTKITFAGGTIGGSTGTSLGTFNHENMHQWFGDNVSESGFPMTFWKEGFATLGEYLTTARSAAGGASSGDAFEASLLSRFNGTGNYNTSSSSFWTVAPNNPTVGNLFSNSNTYTRPGTAYVALWFALGRERMISAMKEIQSTYRGSTITEPQLVNAFRHWLPSPSASCNARLDQFAGEWFDTAYPAGGANTVNKPKITGTGLNGTGFTCATVSPAAPTGQHGWYTGDVSVTWQGFGSSPFTKDGCADTTFSTDGIFTPSCSVTTTAPPVFSSGPVSETVKVDKTPPTSSASISPSPQNGWYASPTVTLSGDDGAGSGIDHIDYSVDGGPFHTYTGPISGFATGNHFIQFRAFDVAGWTEPTLHLVAFKADSDLPTANIARPKDGSDFKLGQQVFATYKCADKQSGLASCIGTVPNGAPIDTSSVGFHTFTVTATDRAGNVQTVSTTYHVRSVALRRAFLRGISRHSLRP